MSLSTSSGAEKFLFNDGRALYREFVDTTDEKRRIAEVILRVFFGFDLSAVSLPRNELQLASPGIVSVGDAGMGNFDVGNEVMKGLHYALQDKGIYYLAKEHSPEDVRAAFKRMGDRIAEHRKIKIIITNTTFKRAPWTIFPASDSALGDQVYETDDLVFKPVVLKGKTSYEFGSQIDRLQSFVAQHWQRDDKKPAGIAIYHQDFEGFWDQYAPITDEKEGYFDLMMAVQPYRADQKLDFKAKNVIAPWLEAVGPDGRFMLVTSINTGSTKAILEKVRPGYVPFPNSGREVIETAMALLSDDRQKQFTIKPTEEFRFQLLPPDRSNMTGTNLEQAAFNAIAYIGHINKDNVDPSIKDELFSTLKSMLMPADGPMYFTDVVDAVFRSKRDLVL